MIKIMVTPNDTTSRKRTREEKWKESEKSDAKLRSVDDAKIAVRMNQQDGLLRRPGLSTFGSAACESQFLARIILWHTSTSSRTVWNPDLLPSIFFVRGPWQTIPATSGRYGSQKRTTRVKTMPKVAKE